MNAHLKIGARVFVKACLRTGLAGGTWIVLWLLLPVAPSRGAWAADTASGGNTAVREGQAGAGAKVNSGAAPAPPAATDAVAIAKRLVSSFSAKSSSLRTFFRNAAKRLAMAT